MTIWNGDEYEKNSNKNFDNFFDFRNFFLLKGTLNNEKKVEIKKTLGNFDYKLMSQNIDRYKLDEGKYSVLPFECEDDIYATYCSALIRQKLMEGFIQKFTTFEIF